MEVYYEPIEQDQRWWL